MTFCGVNADRITGTSRQILFEGLPPQTQDLSCEGSLAPSRLMALPCSSLFGPSCFNWLLKFSTTASADFCVAQSRLHGLFLAFSRRGDLLPGAAQISPDKNISFLCTSSPFT